MSIKTTHDITRSLAIEAILSKLHYCSDEHLERILEAVVGNGFYNFMIVDSHNPYEKYPPPRIESLSDIPEPNDAW